MNGNSSTAAKKLGIKPGTRLTIIGMDPATAVPLLGDMPENAVVNSDPNESADIVLFFADDLDSVRDRVAAAQAQVLAGGRLWVAYRKGKTRQVPGGTGGDVLHRDTLQAALAEQRLVGVSLIALDDTWSAMRVRPETAG